MSLSWYLGVLVCSYRRLGISVYLHACVREYVCCVRVCVCVCVLDVFTSTAVNQRFVSVRMNLFLEFLELGQPVINNL